MLSNVAGGLLAGIALIAIAITISAAWERRAEGRRRTRRKFNLGDNDEGSQAHAFLSAENGQGGFEGDGH